MYLVALFKLYPGSTVSLDPKNIFKNLQDCTFVEFILCIEATHLNQIIADLYHTEDVLQKSSPARCRNAMQVYGFIWFVDISDKSDVIS